MHKNYISLGLMSGTSGDGVDASIITTNGLDQFQNQLKISILNMIMIFLKIFIS